MTDGKRNQLPYLQELISSSLLNMHVTNNLAADLCPQNMYGNLLLQTAGSCAQ